MKLNKCFLLDHFDDNNVDIFGSKLPRLQFVMNSSVGVHSINDLRCCHIEKYVDNDCECNGCEKNDNSEPSYN